MIEVKVMARKMERKVGHKADTHCEGNMVWITVV
jgi:hypothetical protein